MYSRILVPLDGSKIGEAALPYVEELVSKLSAVQKVEVILFQVASPLTHWVIAGETSAPVPYMEKELNILKQQARTYLKKIAESLKAKGAVVKIKVSVGNAANEILKAEKETRAGLVAMSTHGRSGLSRWAFGSVMDKVLRGGEIPVLVVRVPKEQAKK